MARRARPSSSQVAAGARRRLSPDGAARIAALVALAGVAGWIAVVGLQQDFAAYFVAARARGLGLDPYLNHLATPGGPWDGVSVYRHSRFLYPPLIADLFRPLAALPYAWAKAVFTALSVVGLWFGLAQASAGVREHVASNGDGGRAAGAGLALLAAVSWPPIFTALERGQLDLLLLPLLAVAWRRRDQPLVAGGALALGALGKPIVLAALPLLACARRGRVALAAAGATLLLLGLGAAISGPALSRRYLRDVLPRATLFGEGGPVAWLLPDEDLARAGDRLAEGTAQIDGRGPVYAQELGSFRRNASLVRALSGDAAPTPAASVIVLGALAAVLAVAAFRGAASPGWYWGAFLASMLAAPVAWAMSLTLAAPLLFAAPDAIRSRRSAVVAALAVMYGAGWAGLLTPWAWCTAALAGVGAGALLSTMAPGRRP